VEIEENCEGFGAKPKRNFFEQRESKIFGLQEKEK